MKYLLDVNVLVAWGWKEHADHARVARWIAASAKEPDTLLLTSPIPELGFVRVSLQRSGGRLTVKDAAAALSGMLKTLGAKHAFVPDTERSTVMPGWCETADRTTDAHLAQLAASVPAVLATCDERVPGAFVLPR